MFIFPFCCWDKEYGCLRAHSLACKNFHFKDYFAYIGIDIQIPEPHFETPNMKLFQLSIQDFCSMVAQANWDLDNYFAICSYVPDEEARKMVRETFPNCLVYYPS